MKISGALVNKKVAAASLQDDSHFEEPLKNFNEQLKKQFGITDREEKEKTKEDLMREMLEEAKLEVLKIEKQDEITDTDMEKINEIKENSIGTLTREEITMFHGYFRWFHCLPMRIKRKRI